MVQEACAAHAWDHRPEASGLRVERFECSKCHAWGRRHWTVRGLGPLRCYDGRHAPNPRWFELRRADEIVDARNAADRDYAEWVRHGEPLGFARAAYARGMRFRKRTGDRAPASI